MRSFGIKASVLLLLAFLFAGSCINAQSLSYNQLRSIISSKLPHTDVSDKIIAFVTWSSADAQSRDINKEFDRVGAIYQGARLKNGGKGTVIISCNVDDAATGTIVANKDGISYALRINRSEFDFLSRVAANSSVTYDNTGAKLYTNLPEEGIFMAFNRLITR